MPLRNHKRVKFGKIKPDDWNVDPDVDSWAISYIAYHPALNLLRIRFRGRPYVQYEYSGVTVDMANQFFSAPYPRKKTHIPRARSVGASFNFLIKMPRIPFRRSVLEEVKVPNLRAGRTRPDR